MNSIVSPLLEQVTALAARLTGGRSSLTMPATGSVIAGDVTGSARRPRSTAGRSSTPAHPMCWPTPGSVCRCARRTARWWAHSASSTTGHVTRWVWTRGRPRRENGVLFVDGVCSDVTERHRDNARLRQQAELLDLAPTAVIVRDLTGKITYWNRGAESVYGWKPEAVIGCNLHRLLDTRFPVLRTLVEDALTAAGRWHGELDHLRSDGTRIVVLSHQSVQYDEDGDALAILEVAVDVTARKEAERRLADSEERLRTQFALATVGQATIRLDGRFQHVNPALADILGRPVADLEELTLDDITHPDDRPANHRAAAILFTENLPAGRHLRLLHADGRIVDAEVGVSLVRDIEGQPATFIAVVQDVTARLAAERERDAAAALLGERNAELQDTNGRLAEANDGTVGHLPGHPCGSIFTLTLPVATAPAEPA